jgi:hypothetical protein
MVLAKTQVRQNRSRQRPARKEDRAVTGLYCAIRGRHPVVAGAIPEFVLWRQWGAAWIQLFGYNDIQRSPLSSLTTAILFVPKKATLKMCLPWVLTLA